jgi:hypothetical protein
VAYDAGSASAVLCLRCIRSQCDYVLPAAGSGSGSHPYRRIALSRAITEALQSRLTFIAGGRDDAYWSLYRRRGCGQMTKRGVAGVRRKLPKPLVLTSKTCRGATDDVDSRHCSIGAHEKLAGVGLDEAIVVDLTRRRSAIPVVHVTVPGAEGVVTQACYTPGPRMPGRAAEAVMKSCLFVGPTAPRRSDCIPSQALRAGSDGSVFVGVEAGYRRHRNHRRTFRQRSIVLAQGDLVALSKGVEVSGAASMGVALRAAELHPYGMIGIGRAYRLFRRGLLTDDDELAVIHAPEGHRVLPPVGGDDQYSLYAAQASAAGNAERQRRNRHSFEI